MEQVPSKQNLCGTFLRVLIAETALFVCLAALRSSSSPSSWGCDGLDPMTENCLDQNYVRNSLLFSSSGNHFNQSKGFIATEGVAA